MNYSCELSGKLRAHFIQPNGSHAKSNDHDLLSESSVAVFVASRHSPDHHFGTAANLQARTNNPVDDSRNRLE